MSNLKDFQQRAAELIARLNAAIEHSEDKAIALFCIEFAETQLTRDVYAFSAAVAPLIIEQRNLRERLLLAGGIAGLSEDVAARMRAIPRLLEERVTDLLSKTTEGPAA